MGGWAALPEWDLGPASQVLSGPLGLPTYVVLCPLQEPCGHCICTEGRSPRAETGTIYFNLLLIQERVKLLEMKLTAHKQNKKFGGDSDWETQHGKPLVSICVFPFIGAPLPASCRLLLFTLWLL